MKIIFFANTDWYIYNFRLPLALTARDAGHDVLMLSPPGPYGEVLRGMGFDWRPLEMRRRSLNPLREARLLFELYRLIRAEQPAIIHNFTIKCVVYGSIASRIVGGVARVNAIAGMGYVFTSSDLRARLMAPLVRMLLQIALCGARARLILQNPDDLAQVLRARLVPESATRLIPGSGVDTSLFHPPVDPVPRVPFRVLMASRLLWDKGLAEYVQAARFLKAEGRDMRFLLAGLPDEGNPASAPESTVRTWAAEGLVEWSGHVHDMAALLRSVNLVVLPSYREGLPKSLIEAAATGLPIVTTDVPGCRQVVTDGVDGMLVPARDARALASAIGRMQDEPELAQALGDSAREKTLRLYASESVIRKTMAVYDELR